MLSTSFWAHITIHATVMVHYTQHDYHVLGLHLTQVSSNPGAYKPAELARILWGFAAAGADDAKLTKAAAQVLGVQIRLSHECRELYWGHVLWEPVPFWPVGTALADACHV